MSRGPFHDFNIDQARNLIGHWVKKRSGKPFKSGFKEDIVADVAIHKETGRPGFVMASDSTTVEAGRCEEA